MWSAGSARARLLGSLVVAFTLCGCTSQSDLEREAERRLLQAIELPPEAVVTGVYEHDGLLAGVRLGATSGGTDDFRLPSGSVWEDPGFDSPSGAFTDLGRASVTMEESSCSVTLEQPLDDNNKGMQAMLELAEAEQEPIEKVRLLKIYCSLPGRASSP